MLQYFVKRFLAIIPKLLVISMLVFFGMELVPVDPLTRTMDPDMDQPALPGGAGANAGGEGPQ